MKPVEIGRQRAGGPVFSRPDGDYAQFGMRRLWSAIRVGGYTWDNLNVVEVWNQRGSQF